MRKVPFGASLRIIARGTRNWLAGRPIVVSFEVTDSCTCWCRHCDHGGPKDDSWNLKPADYRRYMDVLRPCVVQISGGEPLMREDAAEIVRQVKGGRGVPYTILVSNWSLMTERRYLELRAAGVDQFSVSLDFPDERHDDFRCHPGLYAHLRELVPRLARLGHDDIVLNSCITSANVGEINAIADRAREWGVNVCYSAYSTRRTGCRDYFLSTPEQLAALNRGLDQVESRRDGSNWIVNAPTTLEATRRYFEKGGRPGCTAGRRFLVVTADGMLQPCSMQFQRYPLGAQAEMVREFTSANRCDQCYVSIRSYLDKSFPRLLWENVREYFSIRERGTKRLPSRDCKKRSLWRRSAGMASSERFSGVWQVTIHHGTRQAAELIELRQHGHIVLGRSLTGRPMSLRGRVGPAGCVSGDWDAAAGSRRWHGAFEIAGNGSGAMAGEWIRFNEARTANAGRCEWVRAADEHG